MVFIAGWVLGGGWLLRKGHGPMAAQERRKPKLGKYIQISLLMGLAGACCGLAAAALVMAIGKAAGVQLLIPAAVVGLLAMVAAAVMVLFGMLDLKLPAAAKLAVKPLAAVALLGVVLAGLTAWPSYVIRQKDIKTERCKAVLLAYHQMLERYEAGHGRAPADLAMLVANNAEVTQKLRCPNSSEGETYLYMPVPGTLPGQPQAIRAADRQPVHRGGRNVLFSDGTCKWYSEKDFQTLLSLPTHAAFAQRVKAQGN